MKVLITMVVLITSSMGYAQRLDVNCGEIVKLKEKTKNPLIFPLNVMIPVFRLPALKIKLKNAKRFTSAEFNSSNESTYKYKFAYSSTANYEKHLDLIEEALEKKKESRQPVYVCIGNVNGLDRMHKIASYSMYSIDEAFQVLNEKYNK